MIIVDVVVVEIVVEEVVVVEAVVVSSLSLFSEALTQMAFPLILLHIPSRWLSKIRKRELSLIL